MAGLSKQVINVPLSLGLDLKTDPKQSQRLLTSQNVYRERTGEVRTRKGLTKRTSSINVAQTQITEVADFVRPANTTLVQGVALFPAGNDVGLLAVDSHKRTIAGVANVEDSDTGGAAYVPGDSSATSDWRLVGEHRHFTFEQILGIDSNLDPLDAVQVNVAESGEYRCFAFKFTGDGKIYITVMNYKTGALIRPATPMTSTMQLPFILLTADADAAGDERFLLVGGEAGAKLRWNSIVPATGVITTGTFGTTGADTAMQWNPNGSTAEMFLGTDSGRKVGVVLGRGNDVTNKLRIMRVRGNGRNAADADVLTATTLGTADVLAGAELAGGSGGNAGVSAVVISDSVPQVTLKAYSSAFAQLATAVAFTPNTIHSIGVTGGYLDSCAMGDSPAGTPTHTVVVAVSQYTNPGPTAVRTDLFSALLIAGPAWGLGNIASEFNTRLMAKPFLYNQRVFIPLSYTGQTLGTLTGQAFLMEARGELGVRAPQMHMFGRLFDADVNIPVLAANTSSVLPVCQVAGNTVLVPARKIARLTIALPGTEPKVVISPALARLNMNPPPPQIVVSGSDVVISGPRVTHYDGRLNELGFLRAPEITDLTFGVNGSLSVGLYEYKATYEWTDRFGQLHRSGVSNAFSGTIGAGSNLTSATVKVRQLAETAHFGGDGEVTARAPSNSDKLKQLVTVLWRTQANAATGANHNRQNGQGVGTLNDATKFTVNIADADSDVTLQSGALLYTDGEELENDMPPAALSVLAHKNRVFLIPMDNQTQVWPSKERIPGVGLSFNGDIALNISEDGVNTALGGLDDFTVVGKRGSLYVFGGSGPNNLGVGAFTPPQRISSEVGIRDPNSVVAYSDGLVFKSTKGFHRLDRSLQVEYIGREVEQYNDAVCWAAVLLPTLHQIRFLHDPASGAPVLIYDYLHQSWDTWTPAAGIPNLVHAININDVFTVLDTNGVVWQESVAAPQDNAVNYPVKLGTPWVHLDDIQGYQRVWWVHLIGEFPAAGTVKLRIFRDYDETSYQEVSLNVANAQNGMFRVKPQVQKCVAMRFDIIDTGSSPVLAWRVSKLSLVLAVKAGKLARLKPAASA